MNDPRRGLPPSHPLHDLQTLAALVSGAVLVEASCVTEAQAQALSRALAEVDPAAVHELLTDEQDRPTLLRSRIGALSFQQALELSRALSLLSADARLLPDEPPAWAAARDQRRLVSDALLFEGLAAARWTIADREAPARVELDLYPPVDPSILELLTELREAIEAAVGPGSLPEDGARVAVRRHDGRIGLRLALSCPAAQAARAWEAAAACVCSRMGHDRLRLAPEGLWDVRMTPELVLWLIVAHGPRLPRGDAGPWRVWLDPGPLATELEVELLISEDDLPAAAARLVAADLSPGEARRVTTADGAAVAQVVHATGLRPPDLDLPWRVVPGAPAGLELARDDLDLYPHRGPARWLLRVRDALADRDLVEQVSPRPTLREDRRLAQVLVDVLQERDVEPAPSAGERWLRPVADTRGRPGLQVLLARLRDEGEYESVLNGLAFADAALEPLATVGFGPTGTCIHLWYREPGDPERPRLWGAAP